MNARVLRATELPTFAAIYLVEQAEDGPRKTLIAEAMPWHDAPGLMDARTGEMCRTMTIEDDGRTLDVVDYGWMGSIDPGCEPDRYEPEVDDYLGDLEAADYERGLDRIMERRGW